MDTVHAEVKIPSAENAVSPKIITFFAWSRSEYRFECFCCRPHGLTFTWWGCCDVCFWHKPTELAHSFFILFLCLFLSFYGPFNCISFTLCFLTLFFRPYFCLIGPFKCIFLYESHLQPWCNPLWLTGLKAQTDERFSCARDYAFLISAFPFRSVLFCAVLVWSDVYHEKRMRLLLVVLWLALCPDIKETVVSVSALNINKLTHRYCSSL